MADDAWQRLELPAPPSSVDDLSDHLIELGATGTWQDGDRVLAYFPLTIPSTTIEQAVASWWAAHQGQSGPTCQWQEEVEQDWVTAWQDHFEPLPVGRSLIILPEWHDLADAGERLPVRIRPGRGFGTGGHDTTATCLEMLEQRVMQSTDPAALSLLDVGTGSGVLAIAAGRLGIGQITAFDNDPEAIENAQDNLALNTPLSMTVYTGTLDGIETTHDIVMANLLAHVIVELLPDLTRVLAADGTLIVSGILSEQGDRVEAALTENGLTVTDHCHRGMWLTMAAERSAIRP